MNSNRWKYWTVAAGLLLVPGCSGFGNAPPEPMGLAVEEMRMTQTHDAYAADNHGPLRLNGEKAEHVMSDYRGEAQSGSGIDGDIEINIGK
ncbi:hypothetical protein ADIMK_0485 [Marinobacterium lacunae]|uniref:Lipoprotein n=1 Tax=Marinobacterium lacunae TaxID=1232683 RepID=A0A081G423_9GAMM|nr:hypothetical protein [Marinobacterium lacunae]KEA65528.1 hypothetical protein ADIMK_0485 [Marinobacterium lacunae]MBR9885633.1 hypothetical protein [Oceanospirillales bacterium]